MEQQLLETIVSSGNGIVIFLVTAAFAVVVAGIPVLKLLSKIESERSEREEKRVADLLSVIAQNSAVIDRVGVLIDELTVSTHEKNSVLYGAIIDVLEHVKFCGRDRSVFNPRRLDKNA